MAPRSRKDTIKIEAIMFSIMRENEFDISACVPKFRKKAKAAGYPISLSNCYRWFDRVSKKVDFNDQFQQNVNQFFTNLMKVAGKATRAYMTAEGENASYALDEYLRVAELQKNALNLQQQKNGDSGGIFMQFLQQNNTTNQEIDVNATFQSIQEGLGEFGSLIGRFAAVEGAGGERTIPAICTQPEAENTRKKH